jgi:hypothetical protein
MPGLATLVTQAKDNSALLFNNLSNQFLAMAEQLDQKNKELDERERSLKVQEEKLEHRILELDEREVLIGEREIKLEHRKREGEFLPGGERRDKRTKKLEPTGVISHFHFLVGSTQSTSLY